MKHQLPVVHEVPKSVAPDPGLFSPQSELQFAVGEQTLGIFRGDDVALTFYSAPSARVVATEGELAGYRQTFEALSDQATKLSMDAFFVELARLLKDRQLDGAWLIVNTVGLEIPLDLKALIWSLTHS
jgi:hypothetical protein